MSTWRPPGFMRVARSLLNHSHNLSRIVSESASSRLRTGSSMIRSETCNADTAARRVIFATLRGRPTACCLTVAGQFNGECLTVLGNEIANLATEFVRKFARVRRRYDVCLWVLRQKPGRKQNRRVGAFCATWRHEYHEPLDFASGDRLELADE